ncbi:MAG TPA: carboxypeptidase-like regulatory domain-containing protein, partial [Polyangiales bacterium]|nr:carboxypeptidase-like regulatory domain-containing protein [Polyangiales bacterium]
MKIFQRVVIGLVVVWLGLSVAALLLRSMGGADRTRGMSVAAASEARRADAASRIIAWSLRPRGRAPTGIRGHVFGPDGAVEGARVCASTGGADAVAATSQCASADARGEYAIESLTAGAYFVTATAPGLALGAPPSKAPVLLVTGQVRSDLDITLHAGSRVAGTVVDALGGPIAHAELRAVALAGAQRLVSDTQSDGDGAFELWANAGALVVRAEADGYAPSAVSTVVPNNRVAVVLVPAGRIRGHVVAATSGLPVAGATVRAQASLGSLVAVMPPTAISDAEGAFEIAALPPGSYGLTAEGPDARGSSEGDVAVGLGQTIDGVVIEVALAPRVEGRVIDLDGAPCPRGSLMLGPALPGFTRVSAEQLADAGPSSG